MSGTVKVTARPTTLTTEGSFKYPAFCAVPPLTTVAFNLIAVVAIVDGTVNLLPNVTVMGPPTGIAVIPPPAEPPETAIVY
jgi:hypothetical protein